MAKILIFNSGSEDLSIDENEFIPGLRWEFSLSRYGNCRQFDAYNAHPLRQLPLSSMDCTLPIQVNLRYGGLNQHLLLQMLKKKNQKCSRVSKAILLVNNFYIRTACLERGSRVDAVVLAIFDMFWHCSNFYLSHPNY